MIGDGEEVEEDTVGDLERVLEAVVKEQPEEDLGCGKPGGVLGGVLFNGCDVGVDSDG